MGTCRTTRSFRIDICVYTLASVDHRYLWLLAKSSESRHAAGTHPMLVGVPRNDPSPAEPYAGHLPLLQQRVHRQSPDAQAPCDFCHGHAAAGRLSGNRSRHTSRVELENGLWCAGFHSCEKKTADPKVGCSGETESVSAECGVTLRPRETHLPLRARARARVRECGAVWPLLLPALRRGRGL